VTLGLKETLVSKALPVRPEDCRGILVFKGRKGIRVSLESVVTKATPASKVFKGILARQVRSE
jgi:hypothetical protein